MESKDTIRQNKNGAKPTSWPKRESTKGSEVTEHDMVESGQDRKGFHNDSENFRNFSPIAEAGVARQIHFQSVGRVGDVAGRE